MATLSTRNSSIFSHRLLLPSFPQSFNPVRRTPLRTRSLTVRCNHTPYQVSDPSPSFNYVKCFAPATIANIGPSTNCLGCAVEGIGDTITVYIDSSVRPGSISISAMHGADCENLTSDPRWNCAGIAANVVMKMLNVRSVGISMSLEKGVPLRSGLGSSAASAAAAAVAVNELFGARLSESYLIRAVLESEREVNGYYAGYYADHVGPSILGGFVMILHYDPLQVAKVPFPADSEIFFVLVTPEFKEPKTRMRHPLSQMFVLENLVNQGNVKLLGYMLSSDRLVESSLIPGLAGVKKAALDAGAFGFTMSGAGPTVVAFTDDKNKGLDIAVKMVVAFREEGKLNASATVRSIDRDGARIISRG